MREMKDSGIEWIGEMPKNKKVLRNKYMFSYEKGKLPSSTNLDKKGFAYIGASDLDSYKNEYTTYTEDVNLPNAEYNDLLVLWDGARAGLCGTHKIGKISSTIVRIKGDETVYQPFLYWYYKGFENFMYQSVNGTTIPHMNRKYIENIGFIDWTIQEQQKLSTYLNDKCTKIDSIIEKQEKVIEKLKAYKLSVLTEAVTKGLNPDVKMKESGVQWIGEIPEHWEQTALKVGLADIQTGPFGSQLHAEDYIENGIYVINPANIINGKIVIDSKCSISYEKANELAQHLLSVGDIVFARRGEMGRCACALDDGIQKLCGTGCIKLKCNDRLIPKYIILYLQTHYIKQYLELNSVGTTMLNLNSTIISNIPILIPPISEQQQIVNYLDKKCSVIDKSIEQKQAIIEKLKEYKKSLIYEVVTGKREV